jgi:transcriptional regulator with PAS, ATPase and Fis domain
MFEAELFGSEKGAYTGADRRRTGLVEAAGEGTLFLDEVAEIPLALQAKLLRFLENREYRPLGSTATRHFKGRIVAATNRDLVVEAQAGRFREDLLFRLDVMSVQLPPLRQRASDIPVLAESLLTQLAEKYDRRRPTLRPQDLSALSSHHFPGNVRELRNLLERSLLKTPEESVWLNVDLAWLQSRRQPTVSEATPTFPPTGATPSVPTPAPVAPARPEPEVAFVPPKDRQLSPLEAQEYQMIASALRDENGGIRRAASRLGLTHQALLRRLQKWPELRQAAAESNSSP